MKDSSLRLPKRADYTEVLAQFKSLKCVQQNTNFKKMIKRSSTGKIGCSQNNLEKPRINKIKWTFFFCY